MPAACQWDFTPGLLCGSTGPSGASRKQQKTLDILGDGAGHPWQQLTGCRLEDFQSLPSQAVTTTMD